ncbi:MAG TPA: hypothetical protein VD970_00960 [Acetobacteraceae bacterium]|nr:hypothetical protein [Acetobacteraceae bacterium]
MREHPIHPPTDVAAWDEVPLRKHESGFRLHPLLGPLVASQRESLKIDLPPCCPVSGNPQPGSVLTLDYEPAAEVLESYSVSPVVRQFIGGFRGRGRYAPVRDLEGMLRTLVQMAADALEVPVLGTADLVLDTGQKRVEVNAEPKPAGGA